ncbi:MAG: AAA family ATPase [Candidatus Omnitrophota bacterium]|nr:AAA family ATPase [Candidatus Omnitrophota bacterium]
MEKKIFLAATRQNDGKTMVGIGLLLNLRKITKKVGYIKPVGQRCVQIGGEKIDEDAVLANKIFGANDTRLKDMSPIAIERGFTERCLDHQYQAGELAAKIKTSYARCARGKDIMVIEGTGHAGVGSVFDLNNAVVAKILKAKVVLVTIGGIGKPIDEIMLNKALFDQEGVKILGVIINKVIPEKMEKTRDYLERGLREKGVDLLGLIPYVKTLTTVRMEQIKEDLGLDLLGGREFLSYVVKNKVVGAMFPCNALKYIHDGSLLITPGDRDDLILTALSLVMSKGTNKGRIAGLILTGGIKPHKAIADLIKKARLPVLFGKDDTYAVASRVNGLIVKISETDTEKIATAENLVGKYVDVNKIYAQS